MADPEVAKAINRLADAQFQQAKVLSKANKIHQEQVDISKEMLEMQRTNLRVTAYLEAQLAEQTAAQRTSDGH